MLAVCRDLFWAHTQGGWNKDWNKCINTLSLMFLHVPRKEQKLPHTHAFLEQQCLTRSCLGLVYIAFVWQAPITYAVMEQKKNHRGVIKSKSIFFSMQSSCGDTLVWIQGLFPIISKTSNFYQSQIFCRRSPLAPILFLKICCPIVFGVFTRRQRGGKHFLVGRRAFCW